MMFWNRNKKEKATIANEKKRFNHLLSVAEKLPVKALPDLIRAIVRPVQSDFLLAVAEEGTDARPNMTPQEFFFKGLTQIQSYEKMKEGEMNGADYPLSLASDIVLPWPWSLPRYLDNVSRIGTHKGKPWKQDKNNHSITAGILAGEGTLIPEHVYDMSWMFELVRTDGNHWFVDGQKAEAVKSGRSAAVFEIGRLLVEGAKER
ncbi:hypothetical protein QTL46_004689 [Escherichia coli]|nr:hypothetical protein [Escherichia coli]